MLKKFAILEIVIFVVYLFILSKTALAQAPPATPTPLPVCTSETVGQIRFVLHIDPMVEVANFNSSGGLKLIAEDKQHNCQVTIPNIPIERPGQTYTLKSPVELPVSDNYVFRLSGPRNLEQSYGVFNKIIIKSDILLICIVPSPSAANCGDLINEVPIGSQWDLWTGDANKDGAINLLDFEIYRQNVGLASSTTNNADFNYNGIVDVFDYDENDNPGDLKLLKQNFGEISGVNSYVPRPGPTSTIPPSSTQTPVPPSSSTPTQSPVSGTCIVHPDIYTCYSSGTAEANCNKTCAIPPQNNGFKCAKTNCAGSTGYQCCMNLPLDNHPRPPEGSCDTACLMQTTCNNKCNNNPSLPGYTCVQKTVAICGWEGYQCCPPTTTAAPTATATPSGPTNTPVPRPTIDPLITPATICTPGYPQAFCAYYLSSCEAHCPSDVGNCIPVANNICDYPVIYYKCCKP